MRTLSVIAVAALAVPTIIAWGVAATAFLLDQ